MEITKEILIQELEEMYNKLDAFLNSEIIDISPLKKEDLPESVFTLYCVSNGLETHYFDTLEEREEWIIKTKPKFTYCYISEYLGDVANRSTVFNQYDENGNSRLIAITDKYDYDVYNYDKSKKLGKYTWEHYVDGTTDKCLLLSIIDKKLNESKKCLK